MTAAAKAPLSGHPGHLTPEQVQTLAQFKEELKVEGFYDPAKHDDAMLLRFLRARKFDLAAAKKMWIDTQKWKQSFHVDELYETFEYSEKPQVDKLYPRFYHKTDIDGRPIYIEQLGKLDLTELYKVTTPERQIQSLVVEYEKFQRDRLPICSELSGHLIETSCTIMDLKGVGLRSFYQVKNYVQEASAISQNNYPESMGKFYVINAPFGFSTVWSLVKGWLDPATVAKIHILGSSYQSELLRQCPSDSLPKFLGGTCDCPEGCSMSDAGPWKGRTKAEQQAALQKVKESVAVENGQNAGKIAPPGQSAQVVHA
ncbi:phosphatidylinositol/phosphatidylcholine transfer protein SEC14 [Sporobolomyces koalae]|uniref:phosphatidylinositol/phosphatidylcholine transfer protein SEC14 n=1 Tax=Sporobolomyces koalae TaxID=500713 RepID=UPI00317E1E30